MIISSIDLFFSRDCAGGAGPVDDAPRFAVLAVLAALAALAALAMLEVLAEVLGAADDAVGCVAAADVPRPASPPSFGAATDDVACPVATEVTIGLFVELVLELGIGLNRELPEVPDVVVAVVPELTFLAPIPAKKFEVAEAVVVAVVPEFTFLPPGLAKKFGVGAAIVVAGEVDSAAEDTPVFNAPSCFCPREANRDGAELCVFAPVVDEPRPAKEKREGFVDSCFPAAGTSLDFAVVDEPAVP